MNEFEKLYTIDDIANMTSLTSRTIRNYIKDGILDGKKVGGQWRFTMKDINRFFDNCNVTKDIQYTKKQEVLDFIHGVNTNMTGEIQICTIVDFYCNSKKIAKEMSDKLICSINNNEEMTKSSSKFSYEYIEKESKARFTLFGDSPFIINTLAILNR